MHAIDVTLEQLTDLFVLDALKGFGPQKFKALLDANLEPRDVVREASRLPIPGKNGDKLRDILTTMPEATFAECRARAERQIEVARKHGAHILTYAHPAYPANLLASSHPIPFLYARGNIDVLTNRNTVACVGSRGLRPPYDALHREFAREACDTGFSIVSGFALGADTKGHQAAYDCGGQTVCVMPSGLDRPFPPENKSLWHQLLGYHGAVFVSEFNFGTAASALTLRKRNKVIVALSRAVLISQSSSKGGTMNAFRFAVEQKKPIAAFQDDGTEETTGNAEVAAETKVLSTIFPSVAPDPERYRQWLSTLSSSI